MISPIIDETTINRLRALINGAGRIAITCHKSPDGDALGASLALCHVLRRLGKNASVVTPDMPPKALEFVPGLRDIEVFTKHELRSRNILTEAQLIFCLDFNSMKRIDRLAELVEPLKAPRVLIDHHLDPDDEFDVTISFPEASSTCELVFRTLMQMGLLRYMDRQAASCLYVGLLTDTGGFAFSCDQPSCFEAAAVLVKYNIEPAEIHNRIINTFSLDRMKFYGFALSQRMRVYPGKRVALMAFSLDDQRRFGVGGEDMEGLVNYTLMMKEIEVGALLREEPGRTKVSLRAKYGVDVNRLAAQLGGGGHTKAAGATCLLPFDETLKAVEKLLGIENEEPINLLPA